MVNYSNSHSWDTGPKKAPYIHILLHKILEGKKFLTFSVSQKMALNSPANGQLRTYSKMQNQTCRTSWAIPMN